MPIRTIDLTDKAVQTRKLADQAVTYGTSVHYTKCEKLDAAFLVFTTNAVADRETGPVKHPLGRTPTGYQLIWRNKAGVLYRGTASTAWTSANFYIHCNAPSMTVHVIVF